MQCSRHLKLLPTIAWVLLFSGIIQNNAYSDPASYSDSLSRGATAWSNNCARCHNMRPPSEFSSIQWQTIVLHMRLQAGLTGQEERDIYNFLAAQSPKPSQIEPVSAAAPTLQNSQLNITEQKVETKVQEVSAKPSSTNSIELGKKVFHQTCVACHGENGAGAISGVLSLSGKDSPLFKNSDALLIKRIEEGYKGPNSTMAMPPKGGNPSLTNEQIKAVLEYMKQTFGH